MRLILILNTIIEGMIGFMFLFYPNISDVIPGLGDAEGRSMEMIIHMYGVAAGTMALLSLVTYFSRANRVLVLTTLGILAIFHIGITITQIIYSPDPRAVALHLILAIGFVFTYIMRRRMVVMS